MSHPRFAYKGGVISPILGILVAGALYLAIIDKDNRPAYFDIVKVAVAYSFGSMKSSGNTPTLNQRDDSDSSIYK